MPYEKRVNRTAIAIKGVNVIYPAKDKPVQALYNINLTIDAGEFISFIGPSGCGKTTLLRVIADLEPITSGVVLVNEVSPSQARISGDYGYVFQAPVLFPWRTVLGNAMLPLLLKGKSKEKSEKIARE